MLGSPLILISRLFSFAILYRMSSYDFRSNIVCADLKQHGSNRILVLINFRRLLNKCRWIHKLETTFIEKSLPGGNHQSLHGNSLFLSIKFKPFTQNVFLCALGVKIRKSNILELHAVHLSISSDSDDVRRAYWTY